MSKSKGEHGRESFLIKGVRWRLLVLCDTIQSLQFLSGRLAANFPDNNFKGYIVDNYNLNFRKLVTHGQPCYLPQSVPWALK